MFRVIRISAAVDDAERRRQRVDAEGTSSERRARPRHRELRRRQAVSAAALAPLLETEGDTHC